MTEIRKVVDLPHSIDRVWRALTDRRLLAQWFATTHRENKGDARFQLEPVDLPGFDTIDSELIELEAPHRLVLRWREAERRSLVVCELAPAPDGCHLTFVQTCGEGEWPAADRERRQEAAEQLLTGRLPAVLDWLAFRDVDLEETAVIPRIDPASEEPGQPGTRRGWLIAAAAGLLVAVVVTVGGLLRLTAGEPADAASGPSQSPPPGMSATTPMTTEPARPTNRPEPIASTPRPTPTPSKSAARPPAPLEAHYGRTSNRLFGYSAEVVINNPGTAPGRDWVLVITLPENTRVYAAAGARYEQAGEKVTFTGQPVAAGKSVRIRFDVAGAKRPSGCTINGRACGGL